MIASVAIIPDNTKYRLRQEVQRAEEIEQDRNKRNEELVGTGK